MSNRVYKRNNELVRVPQFKASFIDRYGKVIGPDHDFPEWVWPYIRRLYKAGKLTKDLKVPVDAKIGDYPLVTLPVLKAAGIVFPGYEFAEFPKDFLKMVKSEVSSKRIDQYGKVRNPEDLPNIPVPLWPYVRTTATIGATIGLVLKDADPKVFPPTIIDCINAIKPTK